MYIGLDIRFSKIRHRMTASKNTKFTGGDWCVNKYSYFRVNKGNDVSICKICDVTVEGVINCSECGRRPDQGVYLDLITRGISQMVDVV